MTTNLIFFKPWRVLCCLLFMSSIWNFSYGQFDLIAVPANSSYSASGSTVNINIRVLRTPLHIPGSTGPSYLGYYVGYGQDFNEYKLIGQDYVHSLSHINPYSDESISVDVFGMGVPPGEHYVGYTVDYLKQVPETNEYNNSHTWPTGDKVVIPNSPNLTTDGTTLTKFYEHLWVFTIKMKNNGTAPSGNFWVRSYLSEDDVIGNGDDKYLSSHQFNSINWGNTASKVFEFNPQSQGLEPGKYHIGYIIDYFDDVEEWYELDEDNKYTHAYKVTVAEPKPDLTCTLNSLSDYQVQAGQSINASAEVKNIGTGATTIHTKAGYYLTTKNFWDHSAIYLDENDVDPLSPGQSTPENETFTIPEGTAPGTYNIIYLADHKFEVYETNELNNDSRKEITVVSAAAGPDLYIERLETTGLREEMAPGESFELKTTIKNQGETPTSGTTQIGYFLSTDTRYDSEDKFLGSDLISILGAGQSAAAGKVIIVDSVAPSNIWHIVVVADYLDESRDEIDEENNQASIQFKVVGEPEKSDLVVINASANPHDIEAGNSTHVSCQVKNSGAGSAAATKLGYYLSSDPIWNAGDIELSTDAVDPLPSGDIDGESENLVIPAATPSGTYYILFRADKDWTEAESDENNNVTAVQIRVTNEDSGPKPDLIVIDVAANPIPVYAGNAIQVFSKVNNIGAANSGLNKLGYFLSKDAILDAGDIEFPSDAVGALAPGGLSPEDEFLTIPANTVAGTYYIFFMADRDATEVEFDETNNEAKVEIRVIEPSTASDLEIEDFQTIGLGAEMGIGDSVWLKTKIKNIGNAPLEQRTAVGYYLSVDEFRDDNDYFIKSEELGLLSPGESVEIQNSIKINHDSVYNGSWRILVVADHQNILANETNKDNNIKASRGFSIVGSPTLRPDLRVVGETVSPGIVVAGDDIHVEAKVENIGTANSGMTRLGFFLSTDAVLDPGDIEFTPNAVNALVPNDGSLENATLTIPATTLEGIYYIIFQADRYNTEMELDETNNEAIVRIRVREADVSSSSFEFTPTRESGVFYGQIQLDGVPASEGSWVAAFDEDGNCAGANQVIINDGKAYIALTIYADDPTTPEDEGMERSGEETHYFTITLRDATISGVRQYPTRQDPYKFFNFQVTMGTPMPAYNDPNKVYNFRTEDTATDALSLNEGWNLISFDVIPSDSAIDAVFASLEPGNLEYVSSFIGGETQFYDPNGLPFLNTLTHIQRGYGYWVKVKEADVAVVSGKITAPDLKANSIEGWNLLGYMAQTPTPVAAPPCCDSLILWNSSDTELAYTFENDAYLFYDPNGPDSLNTLQQYENGHGYWVYLKENGERSEHRQPSFSKATPNMMFLNGTTNLTSVGEYVEIKGATGDIVGRMEILPGGYLMTTTIYGDDPLTTRKENLSEGEKLSFHYKGQTISSGVSFDGNKELHKLSLNFNTEPEIRVYPNPFVDRVSLDLTVEEQGFISLVVHDLAGNIVDSTPPKSVFRGAHTHTWKANNQPAGIYFIKVMVDDQVMGTKKVMLVK